MSKKRRVNQNEKRVSKIGVEADAPPAARARFVRAWVEALRSGTYEQGKRRLCKLTDEGAQYCCLGVGYEVAFGEDAWRVGAAFPALSTARANANYWFPGWMTSFFAAQLADKNDAGDTFDKLARIIEDEYL